MQNQPQIKPGIYKHYKTGNLYKVIGLAKHSETLEWMVIYEALYNNPEAKIWVRPANMFLEIVTAKDGSRKQRFEFVKNVE